MSRLFRNSLFGLLAAVVNTWVLMRVFPLLSGWLFPSFAIPLLTVIFACWLWLRQEARADREYDLEMRRYVRDMETEAQAWRGRYGDTRL